jgi:hypothetical protein
MKTVNFIEAIKRKKPFRNIKYDEFYYHEKYTLSYGLAIMTVFDTSEELAQLSSEEIIYGEFVIIEKSVTITENQLEVMLYSFRENTMTLEDVKEELGFIHEW